MRLAAPKRAFFFDHMFKRQPFVLTSRRRGFSLQEHARQHRGNAALERIQLVVDTVQPQLVLLTRCEPAGVGAHGHLECGHLAGVAQVEHDHSRLSTRQFADTSSAAALRKRRVPQGRRGETGATRRNGAASVSDLDPCLNNFGAHFGTASATSR